MSAFDLLSFKPINDPAATPLPPALPDPGPRSEQRDRPFRDQLTDADQDVSRLPRERAENQPPRPPVERSIDAEASAAGEAQTEASLNEADVELETLANETSPPEVDANAAVSESADTEVALDDGVAPAAEFVLDLISAFEQVLEDNPIAQTLIAPSADVEASAFPGLTALYDALTAVSATLGGQGALGSSGLANASPTAAVAPGLTPPAPLPAGGLGLTESSVPVVTPGNASSQTQNESAGGQNPQGQNPSNPALLASVESGPLATANPSTAAIPLPGFDPASSNTAATPVTPLINTNPAGTDVSARLNPVGLTDPNATNDAVNSARLTRGLNSAVNQQGGTVTLRLTPPDLGTVRIQLNLQGTNVTAQFHAETDSAQRLLTQQLGQLRTSLESQGLNVEKLGVQAMSASSNSSSLQQQTSGDNPQSQSQANADGRSRGQFGQSSQQNNQGRDGNADDNAAPTSFTQLLTPDDPEAAPDPAAIGSLSAAG